MVILSLKYQKKLRNFVVHAIFDSMLETNYYFSIFNNPYCLLRREKGEVREADPGTVCEVNQPSDLHVLIFHQGLVTSRHHTAHVLVCVFVRIENTYKMF